MFQLINSFKNKNKSSSIDALLINDRKITDKREMANHFNTFFANIATEIKSHVQQPQYNFANLIPRQLESFSMHSITPASIIKTIKGFKNKSCHKNEIPILILKKVSHIIAPLLSVLINSCFSKGIYPSSLKKARVVPLHKKDSKLQVNNYRPISVLSNINKMLETIVQQRMNSFIHRHSLMNDLQYGFRKGRSTTCAVLHLIQNILNALQKKEHTLVIFLDLMKAFDCVHHSILLTKLERYGFRGKFLEIMASYLSNRTQVVDIGVISSACNILHGVPQGSVLGPLLFNIYINDLSLILPNLFKILFADDTAVLKSGTNLEDLVDQLNNDLIILADWIKYNKLALSIGKTKCMLFSTKHVQQKPAVLIDNVPLGYVREIKYLGLIIDDRLGFKSHITTLKSKLARYQGIIYSLKPYLPSNPYTMHLCTPNSYYILLYLGAQLQPTFNLFRLRKIK